MSTKQTWTLNYVNLVLILVTIFQWRFLTKFSMVLWKQIIICCTGRDELSCWLKLLCFQSWFCQIHVTFTWDTFINFLIWWTCEVSRRVWIYLMSLLSWQPDELNPPIELLQHPPLAAFINSILSAFNNLRHCAPISLASPVTDSVCSALKTVIQSTCAFHR